MTNKRRPLHGIFTAVPWRYDLINHLITLGMDEWWRKAIAEMCLESKPVRFLDLCCGTAGLDLRVARLSEHKPLVIGLDYSSPMLEIALKKAGELPSERRPSFIHGDVANLPFYDGALDVIGISFAFRNLTYHNPLTVQYLKEVFRVLRPGGSVVIVESSQPRNSIIRGLFHLYLRTYVFRTGQVFSGNRAAYKYLSESAAHFYTLEEVKALIKGAGFTEVIQKALFLGVAAIHVAVK